MVQTSKRRLFLERVSCRASGAPLGALALEAEFTRENVETACQALSLKLVSLVEVDDDGNYAFRITRPGLLLLDGQVEEAAALIDRGLGIRRLVVPPPWGLLGSKLRPGGPGMSLKGSGPRAYATQLILAVASGHAIVQGDVVRGNANAPRLGSTSEPRRSERLGTSAPLRDWGRTKDRDRPV
ncbi:hypothetical protein ASF49_14145 [Methylobacterium sp. Leaf104]|uniref:hypothetical protein n=1 Tax=Methylobacterium TaxID=407 RepID=UPI0006F265FD|nr:MULTISPECIES: hypothetical protein [Methylobacterium]KQP30637.1 hypothetical protein ASF49_14145 [Methylobacterium sp. Leaf104]MCI9881972.1 hypothetical protein [Methylobacterium goesingense]